MRESVLVMTIGCLGLSACSGASSSATTQGNQGGAAGAVTTPVAGGRQVPDRSPQAIAGAGGAMLVDTTPPLSEGGEAGAPPNTAGSGGALPRPGSMELADLDTECLGGLTGRDVVAMLQPTYSSKFTAEQLGASSTSSALTIGVNYNGGKITCVPQYCPCDAPPPGQQCPVCVVRGIIQVDLDTTFKTEDGSFAESFIGTAEYSEGAAWVDISGRVPAMTFKGTFPRSLGANEAFSFAIQLQGSKTTGVVSELTETMSRGAGHWGY